MSDTDFPRAVARVSEGFWLLCDGELTRMPPDPPRRKLIDNTLLPSGRDLCWLDLLELTRESRRRWSSFRSGPSLC